jgi:hypothetical protein
MKIATKKTWRKTSSEVSWNEIRDDGKEIETLLTNPKAENAVKKLRGLSRVAKPAPVAKSGRARPPK